MDVAEFYAQSHWGDKFGARIRNGVLGHHSGRDINGWRSATDIPVLAGGRVTVAGSAKDIGGFYEVQVGPNRFDTYCHVVLNVSRGDVLAGGGGGVATIAGWNDDHGTSWDGPHLHFMTAARSGAWANRALAVNPDSVILEAINGGGGGGGGVPKRRKQTMFQLATIDGFKTFIQLGMGAPRPFPGTLEDANELNSYWGTRTYDWTPRDAAGRARMLAIWTPTPNGGSVDPAPVAAAAKAGAEAGVASLKVPTAAENGAAARAAIVKP